jgi:hypothetical protein
MAEVLTALIQGHYCSSPIVASCLLAGSCSNATGRRNTQGRAVTDGSTL